MRLLLISFFLGVFGIFNLLGIQQTYFKNQVVFSMFAIGAFLLFRKVGLPFFRLNVKALYWICMVLLIATYLIGFEAKGSKRWIDLYFFSFQTSEFFKIFFMIFIADFFTRHRKSLHNVSFFVVSLGYYALPTFIIFKQPDLANAIVFTVIYFSIAFFSGIPKKNFVKIAVLTLLIIPFTWFFLQDYQRTRLITFLNPNIDQGGTAYNMIQAIITTGSGKFLGRGLGSGTQSSLSFLPENHTDFAFSSLVEQFGFLGGSIVIVLYLLLAITLIKKIIKYYYQRDDDGKFKFLFLIGFFSYFIFQTFVNIGMNLGVMPIAGIALPLISYGGSSLLTWFIGIALLP